MPLDFSAPRYKGKPLLWFLDSYAVAVIGELSPQDEPIIARAVEQSFGKASDWRVVLRRAAGLPEDFDERLRKLWTNQTAGTGTIAFVLAECDANFVLLIDAVSDDE